MIDKKYIKVAIEFTECPGGRLRENGPFSGQEFRDGFLIPHVEALKDGEKLIVDLDGGDGYGESFLEEAFGGLVRIKGKNVIGKIKIISNDEPELVETIAKYMKSANDR